MWSSCSRPVAQGQGADQEAAGRVRIEDTDKTRKIVVIPDDGWEERRTRSRKRARLRVADGDHVEVGQQLTQGAVDPHDVLRVLGSAGGAAAPGRRGAGGLPIQGVSIHDKHIEIIIRQMLQAGERPRAGRHRAAARRARGAGACSRRRTAASWPRAASPPRRGRC